MTQLLKLNKNCEVLEIGTGSGYQTAILAKLAGRVYTIERHSQLSEGAQAVLGRLGIENVEYYTGDGSCGWPEQKEFDRIILTAAAPQVPEPLAKQLHSDGLIVAPIGGTLNQNAVVYQRKGNTLEPGIICGCRFVRLIGEHGFAEEE